MGRLRLIPNPPTTMPRGSNPAFRQGASTSLWHHNGYGPGDHFVLEVDPMNEARMIVEPGQTTRVWYFAPDGSTGFSQAAIAAAAGVSVATVTAAWLAGGSNSGQHGLRSDRPLAWAGAGGAPEIGSTLYSSRFNRSSATINSEWALFQRGGTYNVTFQVRQGESQLHPVLHGDFGVGARPVFPRSYERVAATSLPRNWVWQGMDFRGRHTWNAPAVGIAYADCNFTAPDKGITMNRTASAQLTLYGTSFIDNVLDNPTKNGETPQDPATDWSQANPNGTDAHFTADTRGFLRWRCFYDRNGWSPTYNIDGVTWNNGQFGQPPSTFSHHCYDSAASTDITSRENVYARAPFDSLQNRPGGYANLIINLEAPNGDLLGAGRLIFDNLANRVGNFGESGDFDLVGVSSGKAYPIAGFSGGGATRPAVQHHAPGEDLFTPGETIRSAQTGATATFTNYAINVVDISGNLNYMNRMLMMGYARLRVNNSGGQRGRVISGPIAGGNGGTYKNMIAANAIDPQNLIAETQNPDLRFRKDSLTFDDGFAPNQNFANAFTGDFAIMNWGGNNLNLPAVSQANRDRVTIGAWADQEQGVALGTNNANGAIDYIRTRSDRCLLAVDIWNYAQGMIGRPLIGHTPGAVARFDPDPDGDGFRTDTPDSWLINGVRGDYPVDGDDCDLDGQLAYSYDTWRFDGMDFGLGGGWRLYGGLISCNTTQGNGTLDLRGAGQFWLTTSSVDINVTAEGGRLGIAGTVSQVRGSFNNRAELLIIPGGALTISTGDTITLTGGSVLMGADGQSGTASLTVQGTLAFVAAGGAMPRVREFRSGRYGLAEPASGVTGQPRDPNVTFDVTLASGSTIMVNTTGLAPGTYDLIVCDSLTNAGATLPANTAIVGGNTLRLTMP
jgi:hypothetical protein